MAGIRTLTRSLALLVLLAFVPTNLQEHGSSRSPAEAVDRGTTAATIPKVRWSSRPRHRHPIDHGHDDDHNMPQHGHDRDHRDDLHTHAKPVRESGDHDDAHHTAWKITGPGYDIRDQPHGRVIGEPIHAQLIAYADFIEAIDEKNGEVIAAIFIKVEWQDSRLRPLDDILKDTPGFSREKLSLPGEMKEKIWVPDLYLPMARKVSVPTIHQPAEAIVLRQNYSVEYSAFFVIAFKCTMTYKNYPMDEQDCNLDIMSYTHNNHQLRLNWGPIGLVGAREIRTKHFVVAVLRPKGSSHFVHKSQDGSKDVLRIKFYLKRHMTFHLIQTYVPSIMLVIVGWLSLLVPLDFAYGRMVLSVTTLLVLVSIFVTTSQTTPGVNEVKALDVWLFMCIFFVFSAIVDCIVDLRFLSMVEKESQIAGEEGTQLDDAPPVVDERLRASQGSRGAVAAASNTYRSYSVVFHGNNTPFQADKEVLIATPAVLKWLRLAVYLERGMTVVYPTLFALFMAVYWSVYLTASNRKAMLEAEEG